MKTSVICTNIFRRGKYSIRKILNGKVVLRGNWNEGHNVAYVTIIFNRDNEQPRLSDWRT